MYINCRHMFFIVRPLQTILVSTLQFLANNAILTSQTQVINIRLFLYFFRKQQMRNGILLPKLFWPTVRKNCSSDREKLLKFEAEHGQNQTFFDPLPPHHFHVVIELSLMLKYSEITVWPHDWGSFLLFFVVGQWLINR